MVQIKWTVTVTKIFMNLIKLDHYNAWLSSYIAPEHQIYVCKVTVGKVALNLIKFWNPELKIDTFTTGELHYILISNYRTQKCHCYVFQAIQIYLKTWMVSENSFKMNIPRKYCHFAHLWGRATCSEYRRHYEMRW